MIDRRSARSAFLAALALLAGGGGGAGSRALAASRALPAHGGPAPREEFLIVSSVDAPHRRIVLKRPTEVTIAMRATERTVFRDEAGKALRLSDLRAGDTAYVTFAEPAPGDYEASLVRLGPMTLDELRKRYLDAAPP